MASVRLAPLALFLLATSIMFWMKKIEAGDCSGVCSPFEEEPCGSRDCRCVCHPGILLCTCSDQSGLSSVAKMRDEHPNLCQSHEECKKKGSGNFCARYRNPYMDYGWCFSSDSEALNKGFLAMPRGISK